MDLRRIGVISALILIVYVLWNDWIIEHDTNNNATNISVNADDNDSDNSNEETESLLPSISSAKEVSTSATTTNTKNYVTVDTDVLHIVINSQGQIIDADLKKYSQSLDNPSPFKLLYVNADSKYIANSNILTTQDGQSKIVDKNYTADKHHYTLTANDSELIVNLYDKKKDNLTIHKQFVFKPGSYLVEVKYNITNNAKHSWQGFLNTQLLRNSPPEDKTSIYHIGSFIGSSYATTEKYKFKKLSFADMAKTNINIETKAGWIAMQQRYFLSSWVPISTINDNNKIYTRTQNNNYTIGFVSPAVTIKSQETNSLSAGIYIGPEIATTLKSIAPNLDLTIDYGWLWFLSSLLFSLMSNINAVVHNWGWTIVIITILIKLLFYRLSAKSYKSMSNMKKIQPKINALRERFGDDKAKLSQATMALYREHKINPLGGCLPMIIQVPVFIALYWVLVESVELRQSPFILWIHDLALPDPLYILPVLMGITMLAMQKLNPAPSDPMQAKIMLFLPVLFTGLFLGLPSGLVLYWVVSNTIGIVQQYFIMKAYK
jgi:YidC/Oxa1 family membrane protein insertase